MNTNYAERHIRTLGLATECAALGARSRTIEYVTGLAHGEIGRLFFSDRASAPQGRAPYSPDWYHNANLLSRAEASIFVSIYRRIRGLGFGPAEALVSGYKHYLQVCSVRPRIGFDRAFYFASHVDGLWIVRAQNFSLVTCPACASQYVASIGAKAVTNSECPFCKLVKRYPRDPRIQTSFPVKAMPDISAMEFGVIALSKRMNAYG
jgi:flagellar transcriptional activator FlhC